MNHLDVLMKRWEIMHDNGKKERKNMKKISYEQIDQSMCYVDDFIPEISNWILDGMAILMYAVILPLIAIKKAVALKKEVYRGE